MKEPEPTQANQEISETITIEQDNEKYILCLNYIGDTIFFNLDYNNEHYIKKLSLKEIKDKDSNAIFANISCKDFINFLKKLSEMNKIAFIKKVSNIIINFEAEFMFIKHIVEIELMNNKQNLEMMENQLKELKQENSELKKRIEVLESKNENLIEEHKNKHEEFKKEINDLKVEINEMKLALNQKNNINKIKIDNKSAIMEENELDLINKAIKSRLDKDVKELIKLYQATVDGDKAINFHSRCDNIANTLVLYKTASNRRFGGFTTQKWSSPPKWVCKDDPFAFVFSLDKKKIYSYKNSGKAMMTNKDCGPCFGGVCDIAIFSNCLNDKKLYTCESDQRCDFNYDGDINALSEDGKASYINTLEYEVFHVVL